MGPSNHVRAGSGPRNPAGTLAGRLRRTRSIPGRIEHDMTTPSTASPGTSEAPTTPARSPRSGALGAFVMVSGVLLAAWMTAGRALFGAGGDMVAWFAFSLGPVMATLLVVTGWCIRVTARRGFRTRRSTVVSLSITGALGLLFGLTVPDTTDEGLASLLSVWSGPDSLEMSIGLCNPLGTITVALAVFSLVFAVGDSRGPKPIIEED
ncbi:hypothetical protein [Klugiella xanthotipulae]|nr:hypothetical protein [Klugiella xanthotipulae]